MKRIAFWIYQVYAWLFFIPVGLLLTLLTGWLTMLVSMIWSPKIASRYIAATWGRLILWLTPVWVEIEGAENADPERTYVVVCNHQSQYDIFVVYGWLKLDLKWVMKKPEVAHHLLRLATDHSLSLFQYWKDMFGTGGILP